MDASPSDPAFDLASDRHEPVAEHFEVPPGPDGVRIGRRHVYSWFLDRYGPQLADDAALVSAELLANAHQHGMPPVVVHLESRGRRALLEVSDASPRWPLVVPASTANMTGRGFALVDALSVNWGVRAEHAGGKTVWCELSADPHSEPTNV
ncbi:MAG: ATP-binding protein, partial [Mycobacterium sp.]